MKIDRTLRDIARLRKSIANRRRVLNRLHVHRQTLFSGALGAREIGPDSFEEFSKELATILEHCEVEIAKLADMSTEYDQEVLNVLMDQAQAAIFLLSGVQLTDQQVEHLVHYHTEFKDQQNEQQILAKCLATSRLSKQAHQQHDLLVKCVALVKQDPK